MNTVDLHDLLAVEGYPAASILLPTHRTHPENQPDPIRVKNLLNHANDENDGELADHGRVAVILCY